MFRTLYLSDVIARFFPESTGGNIDGLEAITLGLESLKVSFAGFPVAGILHQMLRSKATTSLVSPSMLSIIALLPAASPRLFRLDELIDACTMPTYGQPISHIHKRYELSFSADWVLHKDAAAFPLIKLLARNARREMVPHRMQIDNLLNRG
jgi:hypothetical protein